MFLPGCLLTFYPIYGLKDVVYDPAYLGIYVNPDPEDGQADVLHMERLDASGVQVPAGISSIRSKGYLVKFAEKDGAITSQFIAFMVVLKGNYYIDFYPHHQGLKKFGAYGELKIPMHAVYRISLEDKKKLTLRRFDQEFLNELIQKRQIRISHEKIGEKLVVTATTSELQQYISKYGDQNEAYGEKPEIFIKK